VARIKTLLLAALFALIFRNAAFAQITVGPAQNISIVQGNGQLICDGCAGASYSFDDLVVLVRTRTGIQSTTQQLPGRSLMPTASVRPTDI